MATFRVSTPDGRTYNVTAPDGTTKEQVLARIKAQPAPKAAPAPKPETIGDKVLGVASSIADGFLPFGDEAFGLGRALRNTGRAITGKEEWHPGQAFDQGQQEYADRQRTFGGRHPYVKAAGNTVGFVGGLALPAAKVAQGATRAARLGSLVKTGAAYGALNGAGHGDGIAERARNAVTGGATGAVVAPILGTAIPRAVRVGKGLKDALLPYVSGAGGARVATEAAERNVGARLADANLTPAAAAQDLAARQQRGVPAVLADVADPTREAAAWAGRGMGPGQTAVRAAIRQRQADAASRVRSHIDESLGTIVDPHAQSERLSQAATDAAGPLYDRAYAANPAFSDAQRALLRTPAGQRGLANAREIAGNDQVPAEVTGLQFGPDGLLVPDTKLTPRGVDYVKRGIDDVLETYRDPFGRLQLDTNGRAINGVGQRWKAEADLTNPAYGEARQAAAGPLADRAAFQSGANPGTRATPADARHQMADFSDSEVAQFRLGDRTQLADQVAARPRWSDPTAPLNSNQTRVDLIRQIHGDDAANALEQRLAGERDAHLTYKAIDGNSATANRGAIDDDMADTGLKAAGQIAKGGWAAAALTLAADAGTGKFGRFGQQLREEMGRILTDANPQNQQEALAAVQARLDRDAGFAARVQHLAAGAGKAAAMQIPGQSGDEDGMYGPTGQ